MSIDRMLSMFPNAWRSRYEVEVRELLDAQPFTWRARRDVFSACADAWGRELWSWAYAISRVAGAAGVRLAVLLAVGWMGLQLVNVLRGMEFTQAIVAGGGLWVSGAAGFRLPMAFVFHLFAVKPYADSGAAIHRPSWAQTIAVTVLLVTLAALDDRGGLGRQFPDVMILGVTATMRYARWFGVLDTTRPVPNHGRRVLGLQ
jgi:hypothetical protein